MLQKCAKFCKHCTQHNAVFQNVANTQTKNNETRKCLQILQYVAQFHTFCKMFKTNANNQPAGIGIPGYALTLSLKAGCTNLQAKTTRRDAYNYVSPDGYARVG